MSNDTEDDLDFIEQTRAWLRSASAREQVTRQDERRLGDRRGLGFTARRKEDVERNQQQRTFLLHYLLSMPRETLSLWIDGLWLGRATEAELAVLVDAARESLSAAERQAAEPRRSRGDRLMPVFLDVHEASIRHEWRALVEELRTFSLARTKHHAPANQTRNLAARSLAFRNACLESAIGRRVSKANLFEELFDTTEFILGEMAAKLLHREIELGLIATEATSQSEAAMTLSDVSRDLHSAWARAAAERLKQLPAWRTFYRKLKQRR